MRKIKKNLSLVMSLVMVVSLFAGIDITSVAYGDYIDSDMAEEYLDWFDVGEERICNVFTVNSWDGISKMDAEISFAAYDNFEIFDVAVIDESYFSSITIEQDENKDWNISADIIKAPDIGVELFAVTVKAIKTTRSYDWEGIGPSTEYQYLSIDFWFNDYVVYDYTGMYMEPVNCPHENQKDFEEIQSTCYGNGHEAGLRCLDCGDWLSGEEIYSWGHEDYDEDNICDNCSEALSYIRLTADKTEINPGEEFTVTVSVDNAKGLKDGSVSFAYSWADETEYEIVSYEFNENLTYEETDSYYFDFSFDEAVQSDSVDIATVTYKPLIFDEFSMSFYVRTSDLVMYDDHEYISIDMICPHENTTEHPEKDATCTEDGYTAGVYCEDCEEWISGHEWINSYGHEDFDEDGICDNCSEVLSYIRLTADKTEVNLGEEFTVTVSVDNAKGLKDGSITFAHAWWDEYELVSYEFNENLTYFSEYNDNNFIFSFNEAIQSDSVDIVTVTYKPLIFDEFSMSFYVRTSDLVMYDDHEYISIDVICPHKNVSEKPEESPTCTKNGYTAGEQCDDCGEWISGHDWISSLGGHVDEDNDSICDVCGSSATLKVGENIISSAFGDNKFKFKAEQAGLYKIECSSDILLTDGWYNYFNSNNNLICFSENGSITFEAELGDYEEETYFINITLVDDSIKDHSDEDNNGYCDTCERRVETDYFVKFELNGSECTLIQGYKDTYLYSGLIPIGGDDGLYSPYEEMSMGKGVNPYETWLFPYHYEYDEEYNETLYEITAISEGAFIEFSKMEYIVIPRTVKTIGDYAVGYSAMSPDAKIENFVIYGYRGSAAEKYAEDNGFEFRVLYDYEVVDEEVVITEVCDLFKLYNIASTIDGYPITTIGENCFANRELFYLTLPENITTIKAGAFRNNPNLGEYGIEINNTLKTVEDGAFEGCGIVGIAYYGTPEQWSEISIGENNDAFRNAEVTFNGTGHKDFAYIIEDGIVKIVGIDYDADFENLVVPEALDGYTVTELNVGYQDYNSEYNPCDYYQITIPESVTKIREESIGYGYDWEFEDFGLIPGFKIIGVPGSYAETYANENGITFEALPEVPDEPTTEEPTTEEPTTEEPTTEEPTTEEPTTEEPETQAPTTEELTTEEPETEVPTTEPTTKEPETEVPTTEPITVPTTEPPTKPPVHEHDYVGVVTTAPTCTDDGVETFTCECGESYEEVIAATGHNGEWKVVAPAEIGVDGLKQFVCTVCSSILDEEKIPALAEPTTAEITTAEITTSEPTTKEPETEVPTTEEPTTEEPTTEEPTTKEPETQAPTTEKPSERPSTDGPATDGPAIDGPATDGPTEKPVSDKLEVKDDTVKVDNTSKVSTVNTKSSANDILKSVKNEKVSIVDKDGKAISGDALVGTGAKIQIKDNSGKVISTYTVCVPTDVDGNGKTTAADARLALRGSAKLEKVEGVYATASDMNADGKITAADARKILRISAGLE